MGFNSAFKGLTLLDISFASNVKRLLRHLYLILKKCFNRLSSLLKMHYHWCMESNPDIAPLFVRRKFWRCIADGGKSEILLMFMNPCIVI